MSKDVTKKTPTTVASDDPQELKHQIRQRAYELYEARGREDGYEMDDWLRAEEKIRGRKVRTAAA